MGGGGDTVVDGGLSDDQYQDLADNQVGISGQITDESAEANKRFDTFDGRFDNVDSSVAGVGSSVNTGFTNIQDLMDKYNTGLNTQLTNANTGITNNATSMANNATANANSLSDLNTSVTGGFDETGRRFDTVDTANTNMQNTVDQGFVDQAQGFSDAQADRTAQFGSAQDDRTNQFTATGDALASGFTDANTALTQTQANVLGGQGNLQSSLDTMSDTSDIYATQSLENQANLQAGQEGFTSSFDNYVERYGDDTTLANQTRADMQKANANANQKLREDIGSFANSASADRQNISNEMDTQFAELGNTVDGGFTSAAASTQAALAANREDNTAVLNKLQYDLDTGLENLDSGQVVAARDMAKIASTQTDIDMKLRQNFKQLGTAFDDNGQLIANSIDEQGNTISRSVDEQGNLLLRSFDMTGAAIGEKVLNVRSTLRDLQSMQDVQGANASMGNLSPAMSGDVPTTGFASPFATTR
mgnify:FL=1|tara:strand:+ start:1083 stop:2513 length:1431 start_codon:yes stop_codon:yes gene_type:complete